MTFKQKIFTGYLLVFLLFTALLYPVITSVIETIQIRSLRHRTENLILFVQQSQTEKEMLQRLQEKEKELFYRITLFDGKRQVLYDSHMPHSIVQEELQKKVSSPSSELKEALKTGEGYAVRFSPLLDQKMAYMALGFSHLNQRWILRAGFPYEQMALLMEELNITLIGLGVSILLLFSLFAWLILHRLTQPIGQIIQAIQPYQLGKTGHIPEISLDKAGAQDEFTQLAETLNSLTRRLKDQIASLTQEKNEKSAILEALVEGVVAVDAEMHVIYMNRAAAHFLELAPDELVGKRFSLAQQTEYELLMQKAQQQQQPVSSLLLPQKGYKRYIEVLALPLREATLLVLQDKTTLQKIIEQGRDFVANASHELRTPITIIRGFAETLHDHPTLSEELYKQITEKILSNCQRMEALIKNLLILASVDEALPRALQECDLLDLVSQSVNTLLALHPEAQVEVSSEGENFHLFAHSELILQAIFNLLDNAVKYSNLPACIQIHLSKNQGEIYLRITDKGIGIPKEHLDRIFERFYAVDKSRSRSLGGAGLGLSIVARIIEKHRGTISVTSESGQGTSFLLTLPMGEEEEF